MIIGEHLSYENERILQGKPIEFINEEVSDMAILIFSPSKLYCTISLYTFSFGEDFVNILMK